MRCIDISTEDIKLLDSYNVGVSINSLDFSTNWSHLNIGSDKGCMYTYDVNAPGTANLVMDEHNGNFIGVQSLAPGLDQAVVSYEFRVTYFYISVYVAFHWLFIPSTKR